MLYKPNPDKPMHQMTIPTIDGKGVTLAGSNNRWQMIVVYRGLHCPICKTYTAKIEALKDKFDELETDVVFISGDTAQKAKSFASEVGLELPVAYSMPVLLVRGTRANNQMAQITKTLQSCIPNQRSVIISNAAHFLITSHAAECAHVLVDFLNRCNIQ